MAVYPFYVEVNSSSRANTVGVGTREKKGYVETYIYQRDEGAITTPFKIVQRSKEIVDTETNKVVLELRTEVYHNGKLIDAHTTLY